MSGKCIGGGGGGGNDDSCDVCGDDVSIHSVQEYDNEDYVLLYLDPQDSKCKIKDAAQEYEEGPMRPGLVINGNQKWKGNKVSAGFFAGRTGLSEGGNNIVVGCGWDWWRKDGGLRETASGIGSANLGMKFWFITRETRVMMLPYNQEPTFMFLEPKAGNPKDTTRVTVDQGGQLHRKDNSTRSYAATESLYDTKKSKFLKTDFKSEDDFWKKFNALQPKKLTFKVDKSEDDKLRAVGVERRVNEVDDHMFGFVAEEAAEVHPALVTWAWDKRPVRVTVPDTGHMVWDVDEETGEERWIRDGMDDVLIPAEGAELEPESVREDAVLALAVLANQRLKERNDKLEARVKFLEDSKCFKDPGATMDEFEALINRVEALEAALQEKDK